MMMKQKAEWQRMSKSFDMLTDVAATLGIQHGQNRADWVEKFNLTSYAANNIILGHALGEKKTMDLCPNPLEQDTDGGAHLRIIDQIANLAEAAELLIADNIEDAIQQSSNILDIYGKAFAKGFWDKVIVTCEKIVEADKTGGPIA
jgi:hypothetical protein